MTKKLNRKGLKFQNAKYGIVEIIEYFSWDNCTIQFEDGTVVKNVFYSHIKKGQIKNPNQKNVHGEGYLGQGKYIPVNYKKIYKTWVSILERCYSEKWHIKNPTYKTCTIIEQWKCFQIFAEWMENNYNPENMQGWHLDKDILVKGNKVYSPETCRFVPLEINSVFVVKPNSKYHGVYKRKNKNRYIANIEINKINKYLGSFLTYEEAFEVYKIAKESYIKYLAKLYKNKISDDIYNTLCLHDITK